MLWIFPSAEAEIGVINHAGGFCRSGVDDHTVKHEHAEPKYDRAENAGGDSEQYAQSFGVSRHRYYFKYNMSD